MVVNLKEHKLVLDWCSYKQAKYSVLKWHYSKKMPIGKLVKIGVWENNNFIGCVLYGDGLLGSTNYFLGINKINIAELVRVALGKHKNTVTKIISISLKLLKLKCPNIELIVSFADNGQKHLGIIYQAGNWIYTGSNKTGSLYRHKKSGKIYHDRSINRKGIRKIMGKYVKTPKLEDCEFIERTIKHRYLYPLTKEMREQILKLKKEYPKKLA